MKINLDYFKENELNKLTDEESLIIEKYFKGDLTGLAENLLGTMSSYQDVVALSENRKNIVAFYPINNNETVLEIGAGFGEITESFTERAKEVISIESKKEKAEAIAKRYNSCPNLTVVAGEIEDISFDNLGISKFDVISLIGVIDYKSDLDRYLNFAKKHLTENGKILIAINNKFGVKYFTGVKRDKETNIYNTIINESIYAGIEDVENYLSVLGYKFKRYYPMPDYTFTNAIYTDEFLPTEEHIVSRDLECFDTEINHVNFSEREVLKNFVKKDKNMFKYLSNSYLIVASKSDLDIGIKAVTYGTFRKPEYRIKTVIKEKEVIKTSNSNMNNSHIENMGKNIDLLNLYGINTLDSYNNGVVSSKFVSNVKTLDKVLYEFALSGDFDGLINKVLEYKKEVLDKLEKVEDITKVEKNVFDKYGIKYSKLDLNKLTFVKYGIYDLISQNCFVIDNKFYVYDQEWMEENVPLEYILYRIILYLPEVRSIFDEKELYQRLNLNKFVNIFRKLDERIQDSTKNNAFWETHLKSINSVLRNIQDGKTLEDEIIEKNEYIRNLENKIVDSDKKISSYETQISTISNSLSWKLTKPFRFLAWIFNPFSGASFIDRIMPPGGRRRIKYDEKLTKKLWEQKLDGYRAATDEEGVEYWKGIEHRERLLRERTEERKRLGTLHNYEYWIEQNEPSLEELELQRKVKFKNKPKISIVVPLYNTPEDLFRELIFNLYRQTYSNWELCLADGSKEPLENIQKMCKDSRIKYKFLGKNLGISGNSNEGLKMVTGDWVALLDHDDLLKVDALFEIVKVINERPNVRFIYTDEDKIKDIDNPRFDAHFKPDFSPDYLRNNNYICHFSVFKKEVMDKLEGFRDEYNGAQDLDIILRMSEIVDAKDIYHIPKVLYHWRICETSTAGNPETKLYAYESGKKAVQDHIDRMGIKGVVERDPNMYGIYRPKYDVDDENEKASILISNYENKDNLEDCIEAILYNTKYKNYEIVIILDKVNNEISEYLSSLKTRGINNIKIYDEFEDNLNNFGRLNYVINKLQTKYLVFIDGDVEIREEKWLIDLVGFARREDVGAVGGKIYDELENIVFAGRVVNKNGVINLNEGHDTSVYGYFAKECHIQNVTSVSSRLMIVSKDKFDKIGGFDASLEILSDVELNLKLLDEGYLNIYTPYVYGIDHRQSIENKKLELEEKEIKEIITKRNIVLDKYYNINFNQEKNNYEIRKDKVNL